MILNIYILFLLFSSFINATPESSTGHFDNWGFLLKKDLVKEKTDLKKDPIGQVINGKYEIIKKIGQGTLK